VCVCVGVCVWCVCVGVSVLMCVCVFVCVFVEELVHMEHINIVRLIKNDSMRITSSEMMYCGLLIVTKHL